MKGIHMRTRNRGNAVKDWGRLALKGGLLLLDPRVRAVISDQVRDRVDDVREVVRDTYDEASGRFSRASDAIRGRSVWPQRAASFLIGVGIGAGVGLLLAPSSGAETREVLRSRAMDAKERMSESVSSRLAQMRESATGTEGI
jgi:hypothetical protein